MAGTFPNSWQETCLVSIMKKGEGVQQFAAMIESVDISEPDYPGESIKTVSGGRLWKQTAQEDGEITLEMYPISVDFMKGGAISSIDGDATETTLTTSAAHGLAVGDGVEVGNSTNYGTTASPTLYTVKSVTSTTVVVMTPAVNQAEETDGTWVGYLGNKGLFQQYCASKKVTAITTIDGDVDSVDIAATAHGCQVGDIIEVKGTTNYNGKYVVATRTDADNFVCTDETHNVASESVGTITKIADASQPLTTDTSYPTAGVMFTQDGYMVAILWTGDTAAVSATNATTDTDKTALRFYAKECKVMSHKSSFTDGVLKVTVTFKFPAMTKAGTAMNFAWESTDDTDTSPLPALTYS